LRFRSTEVLAKYVSMNGEGSWVKLLKWKFPAFFAYYRGQDIPKKPDMILCGETSCLSRPHVLLSGTFSSFVKDLRTFKPTLWFAFLNSTLHLKKSMPCVPSAMVEKAERDCLIKLTTDPTTLPDSILRQQIGSYSSYNGTHSSEWDCLDTCTGVSIRTILEREYEITMDVVEKEIRRSVTEIYGGECFGLYDIFRPFFLSSSANYIWSRRKGGAISEISKRYNLGKDESYIDFATASKGARNPRSKHYGDLGRLEDAKFERDELESRELGYDISEEIPTLLVDTSRLEERWESLYRDMFRDAIKEEPCVLPVGLSEPLKVRVISKGPPLLYSVLKPFQKWLWKCLKKHSVFFSHWSLCDGGRYRASGSWYQGWGVISFR
jgi:uncharacterized protein YbaR (Trm112 family)